MTKGAFDKIADGLNEALMTIREETGLARRANPLASEGSTLTMFFSGGGDRPEKDKID